MGSWGWNTESRDPHSLVLLCWGRLGTQPSFTVPEWNVPWSGFNNPGNDTSFTERLLCIGRSMCLGSIFSMALAVILSFVSSFFSHAPRLSPPSNPKQLNLYCLDTVQACPPGPVPSCYRLFGYRGLWVFITSLLPDILGREGPSFCSIPNSLRMNPETVEILAAPGRGNALCTVSAYWSTPR